MSQRNWVALTIIAVVAIVLCAALWFVFVGREQAPGATGSIPGAETPATATPVTPKTP